VVLFLLLLLTLHFLEPEFDPSTRLISEYELGRYGWIMSLAFFSLAVAVGGMLLSTWSLPTTRAGLIGRWWFVVICLALIGACLFYPSTAPLISSLIHGVCGMIVIATFPIAATLYSAGAAQIRGSATSRPLQRATLLVWVGFWPSSDRWSSSVS
jgi:protein-S-isoprenylcysteine O-methyltransferase Ste14